MLKFNDENTGVEALEEDDLVAIGDEAVGGNGFARIGNSNGALAQELDALSLRISARTREFSNSGKFSNSHNTFLERREKRRAEFEATLEAAVRRGDVMESIRLELLRDFDALFGNFGDLIDRMDAAAMKGRL
jgi:hypothetical protein